MGRRRTEVIMYPLHKNRFKKLILFKKVFGYKTIYLQKIIIYCIFNLYRVSFLTRNCKVSGKISIFRKNVSDVTVRLSRHRRNRIAGSACRLPGSEE